MVLRKVAGLLVASLALTLAACGADEVEGEAPRPVLVVRPEPAGDAALAAFPGEIRAREESVLSFRVGGNLVRREVDVGERVVRGQVLATLDPGDLALQAQAAQAQLAAAEAELRRARADLSRYGELAGEQLVSRSALDAQRAAFEAAQGQARSARSALSVARNQSGYAQLRAPRDGVIASRQAEAGQVVAAGQPVFGLAADGGRDVAIALPEVRIRDFRVGQQVEVAVWSQPGTRLPGTIREIAPAADPQARTYAARVALDGAAADVVELGQSARVYLRAPAGGAAPSVPLSAVQRAGNGATALWVVNPATRKLSLVPVRLGPYADQRVPVLEGLRPDALVVAAGGHLLREGQRVTPVDRDNRPVADPAPAAAAR